MRKHVRERIARNRELAQRDRANRCDYCKGAFRGEIFEAFLTPGRFCSQHCLEAATDAVEAAWKRLGVNR